MNLAHEKYFEQVDFNNADIEVADENLNIIEEVEKFDKLKPILSGVI